MDASAQNLSLDAALKNLRLHDAAFDYSVVIPTRGTKAGSLWRAVCSAATQAPPPREIVVVVDGGEVDTCRAAAPTARVVALDPPSGGRPGLARNAGVEATSGAFVAFLDDDDEWLPGKAAACAMTNHWIR